MQKHLVLIALAVFGAVGQIETTTAAPWWEADNTSGGTTGATTIAATTTGAATTGTATTGAPTTGAATTGATTVATTTGATTGSATTGATTGTSTTTGTIDEDLEDAVEDGASISTTAGATTADADDVADGETEDNLKNKCISELGFLGKWKCNLSTFFNKWCLTQKAQNLLSR